MFENLGDKLTTLRVNQNLSRKQVAERVGVSLSMIGLYETGERQPSVRSGPAGGYLIRRAEDPRLSADRRTGKQ